MNIQDLQNIGLDFGDLVLKAFNIGDTNTPGIHTERSTNKKHSKSQGEYFGGSQENGFQRINGKPAGP